MTRATPALKAARRCYGHLAGEAGIQLRQRLELAGLIRCDGGVYVFGPTGRAWATALALDVDDRDAPKHARCCLDWTERQPHIGGRLGRSLLELLMARGVVTAATGRVLHLPDLDAVWQVLRLR
ncbi:MAG TPA: hypothetical protein PLE72_07600 [Azospira sp.]|nr:hypothetical protein [Azospira sp.]HNN09185.1 hypothetical protein [Azospira sp.]